MYHSTQNNSKKRPTSIRAISQLPFTQMTTTPYRDTETQDLSATGRVMTFAATFSSASTFLVSTEAASTPSPDDKV